MSLAVTPSGHFHLSYQRFDSVWYAGRAAADITWSRQRLDPASGRPALSVDDAGEVHVVYYTIVTPSPRYISRSTDGFWSVPQTVVSNAGDAPSAAASLFAISATYLDFTGPLAALRRARLCR